MLYDEHQVLPVSSLLTGHAGISDVCLSLPTVLNRSGVKEVLRLQLAPDEVKKLQHSAEVLRASIGELENQRAVAT